ncbi:MAG: DUF3025 domain-containing protein [Burkholderiaceae bacterium]
MAARRSIGNWCNAWFDVSEHFFDGIDWHRPWLAPLLPVAMQIVQAHDWRQALNVTARELNLLNHRELPIQFVAQSELPSGVAYEAFISATGRVPTRDNAHDFFNALVWLTFPQIKAQLNALQAAAIAQAAASESHVGAIPQYRGKLRDAATIFDENAALLVTRNVSLVEALRGHQWHDVFVEHRAAFERNCDVWLFGHALMEKLVSPYKAITAHAWIVAASDEFFALSPWDKCIWIDTAVTQQITAGLATADFTPLPVLGVPGWWHSQDAMFYADSSVFRPKRV